MSSKMIMGKKEGEHHFILRCTYSPSPYSPPTSYLLAYLSSIIKHLSVPYYARPCSTAPRPWIYLEISLGMVLFSTGIQIPLGVFQKWSILPSWFCCLAQIWLFSLDVCASMMDKLVSPKDQSRSWMSWSPSQWSVGSDVFRTPLAWIEKVKKQRWTSGYLLWYHLFWPYKNGLFWHSVKPLTPPI